MLRAYVLDFGGNWEEKLHFVELAYNKNYQASINMVPCEAFMADPVSHLFVGPSTRIASPLGLISSRTPHRLSR